MPMELNPARSLQIVRRFLIVWGRRVPPTLAGLLHVILLTQELLVCHFITATTVLATQAGRQEKPFAIQARRVLIVKLIAKAEIVL